MRIVGGKFKGRSIAAPSGQATRPTSDRVREAIFNILAHGIAGFGLEGARVLDLFAGTGAMGLEALSRGARFCQFVDDSAAARGLIGGNADGLGVIGQCKIWRRDATKLGPAGRIEPFDLVLCDPPYGTGLGQRALAAAVEGGWTAPGAVIVLEERAGFPVDWPAPLAEIDRRRYGDTEIAIARAGT